MIKIIIPVEEDVMDGVAALLKMSCKPAERDAVNTVLAKIKQEGTAEVSSKAINEDEAKEALAGIVLLAIASNIPEE